MSKQITNEDKQRVFALYWGQSTLIATPKCTGVIPCIESNWVGCDKAVIEVKPLSDITDEDAIEVARLMGVQGKLTRRNSWVTITSKEGECVYIGPTLSDCVWDNGVVFDGGEWLYLTIDCIDFLRSRGYALPALGWYVDELVAAGVFKLKTKDNE